MNNLLRWMALGLSLLVFPAYGAVLQINSSGTLMGATGVDVNGTFYDVTFQDGVCADLYNGCDQTSDFMFHTSADALAASAALLNQVTVDDPVDPTKQFDTNPDLTNGCYFQDLCEMWTPFYVNSSGDGWVARAVNYNNDTLWLTNATGVAPITDLATALLGNGGSRDGGTWAVWSEPSTTLTPCTDASCLTFTFNAGATPSPITTVPEPSAFALFGLGFVGMGIAKRKGRRKG
ncbi:MAG: PEP-CTERM sorting domain-containing protein [Gammaproteobacteria bacterium]